jgi:hypothetical protein
MSTELDIVKYAQQQDKVVSLWARGHKVSDIMSQTGLQKRQVDEMIADYKKYAQQDRFIREMSRDTLIKTRQHYDDILEQMYSAVAEAEDAGDYKTRIQGLKSIADIENQRVNFMQKAGMLADNEIGSQLAEYEQNQEIIMNILKKVAKEHPEVGLYIQTELSRITGVIEGVPSERVDQ